MSQFRFRPSLQSLETRETPAVTPESVFAAVQQIQDTPWVLDWLADHPDVARAGGAPSTLFSLAQSNRDAAGVLTVFLNDLNAGIAANQASNPALANQMQSLLGGTGYYIAAALSLAQQSENLAIGLGGTPPLPPPPPPPPGATPSEPVSNPNDGFTPAPADNRPLSTSIPDLLSPGWRQIADGLWTRDVTVGTGTAVAPTDTVTVDYTGWLLNGTQFDSSVPRGEPSTFPLSGVIRGWQIAIPGMRPGGIRQLFITSSLAYGEAGSGSSIPPNSDLVFEVRLQSIA